MERLHDNKALEAVARRVDEVRGENAAEVQRLKLRLDRVQAYLDEVLGRCPDDIDRITFEVFQVKHLRNLAACVGGSFRKAE